ncbi:MAG: glycosyltransferase family 2 protein [Candidatus Aminicenantes bacterium]|nr:MAG: glycosyltransferase family 2 protein [Candidatus Aminicenantes bacterium]
MNKKAKSIPKVSVIILNWNQRDYTVECLNSVLKSDYPNYEAVVIDNVSSDDSCEVISKQFPSVKLIRSEKNLGITDSRNIGIDYALSSSADYIMFLDNDAIVHKNILSELVSEAEKDKRVAIVTPKIYFYSDRNRIWSLGGGISFYTGNTNLLGNGEIDHGQYDSHATIEVDHAIGCCLMVRSQVIKKIGKLDSHFYYGEDTELSIRARRSGYKIVAIPKAVMWHKDSNIWATKDIDYIRSKEVIWLMRKHARLHHWIVFCFHSLFVIIRIALRKGTRGNLKSIFFRIKGVLDGMRT